MDASVAIACLLSDRELQQRRSEYLDRAALLMVGRRELPNDFAYTFRLEGAAVALLAQDIELERKCCPFLDFAMSVRAGERTLEVTLSGPVGAKEAVRTLVGWS